MTQLSLVTDDPMAMVVDDVALASSDMKSYRAAEESPVCEHDAQDNQSEDAEMTAVATPSTQTNQEVSRKQVVFADADVIEFEPTVWTATISSDGVPVGLSSNVRRRTRRRLDSYEGERLLQRVNRQEYMEHGYLEPYERLDMLEAAGHSITIISHVERDNVRLNRERWESNEYDLLYQFGLGEPAIMDLDEDTELLLSQGTILGLTSHRQPLLDLLHQDIDDVDDVDDDDEMVEAPDEEEGNPAEYYYYANRAPSQMDADVRFAVEEIDAYDTRKYEEWAWDYSTDCVLSEDPPDSTGGFDLPSLDFGLPELSSSPTDVSGQSECMVVSCGKIIGMGSPSPSLKKASASAPTGMLV